MRKSEELSNPKSCINKAKDDEWTFVLLARDPAAPAAILAWVQERVRLGRNSLDDGQISEALACAQAMSVWRENLTRHHSNPSGATS